MKKLFVLLTTLSVSSAHATDLKACGNADESVSRKINDCLSQNGDDAVRSFSSQEASHRWVLVTKNAEGDESWMDLQENLLWSPVLSGGFTWDVARAACAQYGKGYRLPSRRAYSVAEGHHIREILQSMNRKLFWTSSESGYPTAAYFFSGTEGYLDDGTKSLRHYVRCVLTVK